MQVAQAQIIKGTTEEIARQLQQSYPGRNLRVIVEAEATEDLAAGTPTPPFAVRDQAHLEELLLEGVNSPARPFTEEMVEEMRGEVRRRHAARQQKP